MWKFELISETTFYFGHTLYRIEALVDFGSVKAGDKGGFVEKDANLSHGGNAWISGNAWVYENAWIDGDAWVDGNARIFGNAWIDGDACIGGDSKISGNTRISKRVIQKGPA